MVDSTPNDRPGARRVASFFRRPAGEEVREELESHVEMRTRDLMAQGRENVG